MSSAHSSSAVLEVNLGALVGNYKRLCEVAEGAEVSAVVKADAYGLGMIPVARRLFDEGCRKFFVATIEEGISLRDAVPKARIYVFNGVDEGAEALFVEHGITPVLNSIDEARRWAPTNRRVALHIDTGMSRLGFSLAEVEVLAGQRKLLDALQLEYVMTHLACAEEVDHPLNAEQLELFEIARRKLPAARTSIANTAGIFLGPTHRGDLVRPGIGLYGGNPFTDRASPVRAVASLRTRILQIRHVERDMNVGYGATYRAVRGDRLAVVGIGYADGYVRLLSNRAVGFCKGHRLPVVGRVSMDLLVLDATEMHEQEIAVGDYVELFGENVSVDDVAHSCGTISYEILAGLGNRIERVYVD